MLGKLLGLIPVANSTGEKSDIGELNAALGKTWTSVPARQAADGSSRAGDTQVSGDWAP